MSLSSIMFQCKSKSRYMYQTVNSDYQLMEDKKFIAFGEIVDRNKEDYFYNPVVAIDRKGCILNLNIFQEKQKYFETGIKNAIRIGGLFNYYFILNKFNILWIYDKTTKNKYQLKMKCKDLYTDLILNKDGVVYRFTNILNSNNIKVIDNLELRQLNFGERMKKLIKREKIISENCNYYYISNYLSDFKNDGICFHYNIKKLMKINKNIKDYGNDLCVIKNNKRYNMANFDGVPVLYKKYEDDEIKDITGSMILYKNKVIFWGDKINLPKFRTGNIFENYLLFDRKLK